MLFTIIIVCFGLLLVLGDSADLQDFMVVMNFGQTLSRPGGRSYSSNCKLRVDAL